MSQAADAPSVRKELASLVIVHWVFLLLVFAFSITADVFIYGLIGGIPSLFLSIFDIVALSFIHDFLQTSVIDQSVRKTMHIARGLFVFTAFGWTAMLLTDFVLGPLFLIYCDDYLCGSGIFMIVLAFCQVVLTGTSARLSILLGSYRALSMGKQIQSDRCYCAPLCDEETDCNNCYENGSCSCGCDVEKQPIFVSHDPVTQTTSNQSSETPVTQNTQTQIPVFQALNEQSTDKISHTPPQAPASELASNEVAQV